MALCNYAAALANVDQVISLLNSSKSTTSPSYACLSPSCLSICLLLIYFCSRLSWHASTSTASCLVAVVVVVFIAILCQFKSNAVLPPLLLPLSLSISLLYTVAPLSCSCAALIALQCANNAATKTRQHDKLPI